MQLSYVLAYHRMVSSGAFTRVFTWATGSFIFLGIVSIAAGLWKSKHGMSAAGIALITMGMFFGSIGVMVSAARAAHCSVQQLAPHVAKVARRYLVGVWILLVTLGVLTVVTAGGPPAFGLLIGVPFCMLGMVFGGRIISQAILFAVLGFLLDRLSKLDIVPQMPASSHVVLFVCGLFLSAIYADKAIRFALNPVLAQFALRQDPPQADYTRELSKASPTAKLSMGLGPSFSVGHWAMLSVYGFLLLWMGAFSPLWVSQYYILAGAVIGPLIGFYLATFWVGRAIQSGGSHLLMLAPALPNASDWNAAMGKLLLRRALVVAAVALLLAGVLGACFYSRTPRPAWWIATIVAPLLISLTTFADYQAPLLKRARAVLGLSGVLFLAQVATFMILSPLNK